MAAPLLIVGSADLSDSIRAQPGEGFDPSGGGTFEEPSFLESPFGDGEPLASLATSNRQIKVPLFLRALDPAQVSALENRITNPSFETATTGWVTTATPASLLNAGATLTQDASGKVKGSFGALLSSPGSATNQGTSIPLSGVFYAGVTYSASISIKASSGATDFGIALGASSTDAGTQTVTVSAAWQRVTVSWTPTTTTATAYLVVRKIAASAGAAYFDAAAAYQGSDEGYFDGDQPGYYWTGTQHLSTSKRRSLANLITNPSGETLGSWIGFSGAGSPTVAVYTDDRLVGAQCLKLTCVGSAASSYAYNNAITSQPVEPGRSYTASAHMRNLGVGRAASILVNWYDTTGAFISTSTGGSGTVGSGWGRFTFTATAPAGAAYAVVAIGVSSANASEEFLIDATMLNEGSSALAYGDGDRIAWYWSGAANASASLAYVGKDGLHAMISELRASLQAGSQVTWRDRDATATTYFSLAYGRLEPDYNYWLSASLGAKATVTLWVQPYGDTGTDRIVATGIASGPLLTIPIPTTIQGGVPGLLTAQISEGSQVVQQDAGRVLALAVLPHPSYMPDFPAGSFTSLNGAALTGGSGAPGSQFVRMNQAQNLPAGAKVALPIPSVYGGRQRVFGLVRSSFDPGWAFWVSDHNNNPIGPTVVASAMVDWQLADFGALNIPSPYPGPSSYWLNVNAGPMGSVSPGLLTGRATAADIARLMLMPEPLGLWTDRLGYPIADDDFDGVGSYLAGTLDSLGNTWAAYPSSQNTMNPSYLLIDHANGGRVYLSGATMTGMINNHPALSDAVVRVRCAMPTTVASQQMARQMVVTARVNASTSLDVYWYKILGGGFGSACLNINTGITSLASVGAPSAVIAGEFELTVMKRGGVLAAGVRAMDDGRVVASAVSGSNALMQQPVQFGIYMGATAVEARSFSVRTLSGSPVAPADVYTIDGPNKRAYRNAAGADVTRNLAEVQKGAIPQLPAPSPAAVAILAHPGGVGGGANDPLSAVIKVRERFSYSR